MTGLLKLGALIALNIIVWGALGGVTLFTLHIAYVIVTHYF